jgi:DNA-binding MarR family transcriptional regulator
MTRQQKIQSIFEGFMAMQKAIGTRKDRFLKLHDLTRPQMHILYALAHGKQLTVKEIAAELGVTSGAATQFIEGLVNLDYVERNNNEIDHRVVDVRFSKEGKKKFENFRKAHMERIGRIFDVITDQELNLLTDIPGKILRHAEQIDNK